MYRNEEWIKCSNKNKMLQIKRNNNNPLKKKKAKQINFFCTWPVIQNFKNQQLFIHLLYFLGDIECCNTP